MFCEGTNYPRLNPDCLSLAEVLPHLANSPAAAAAALTPPIRVGQNTSSLIGIKEARLPVSTLRAMYVNGMFQYRGTIKINQACIINIPDQAKRAS
jgi:hypothetical protein